MKKTWIWPSLGAVLILLLTFIVYLPVMRAGFIWDDGLLITDNPLMKAGNGLYRFWFTRESADYWPLTSTLWWIEWRLWGNNATGYHVVNVLLHALNAVLLWTVLRHLKIPGPWLVALVFALHPVNVATVAWISEQKNTLAMLFYLITLLLYLKFDEDDHRPISGPAWRLYGCSLVAFALALLSKTAIVMLPVVLLGCAWWRRDRIEGRDLRRSVPFFVLSLLLGLVTISFQHSQFVQTQLAPRGGPFARLAVAGWMPWFYLCKALLPFRLNVIYPKWEVDVSHWVSYAPGVLFAGCLAFFWWKRRTWGRPLLFGLGYFVVMLFPVLGFFDQTFHRFSFVADHWQYYSIVGVIALAVAGVGKLVRYGDNRFRYLGVTAAAAGVVLLGVGTWTRARVYKNSETLWQDTVTKNPAAWAGHNNLGLALLQMGQPKKAVGHFERALQLKPDYADAHYNLGIALAQNGRIEDAIAHYEQALQLAPDSAEAHNNLGIALRRVGRIQDAISHFQQALRITPDDAEVHYNLATTLKQAGKINEAIEHFEEAVRIKPDFVVAHYNLGVTLAETGRTEEPIRHFEEALRLKPDYKVHNHLGLALEQVGRVEDAIRHYEEALRLNPDYLEAHSNLAAALWQTGRTKEAIPHLKEAVRLNPDIPESHYNLAAALERVGRLDEASKEYEQALHLKPDFAEAEKSLARLQSGR